MNKIKSKKLTINGAEVTVHSDGSISKPNNKFKDKRIQRTFGSTRGTTNYMQIKIGSKVSLVHRVVAEAFFPDFNDFPTVDHIDGNGANNDISNLRMATTQMQGFAHRAKSKGCSSQYIGVTRGYKAKWQAQCNVGGKINYVGCFDSELEAAIARDAFAFSRGFLLEGLNFPELLQSKG